MIRGADVDSAVLHRGSSRERVVSRELHPSGGFTDRSRAPNTRVSYLMTLCDLNQALNQALNHGFGVKVDD